MQHLHGGLLGRPPERNLDIAVPERGLFAPATTQSAVDVTGTSKTGPIRVARCAGNLEPNACGQGLSRANI